MINKLSQIKKPLLMGPGPSCVSNSVYQALAKPTLGHLDPEFISLMDEIKEFLHELHWYCQVFQCLMLDPFQGIP